MDFIDYIHIKEDIIEKVYNMYLQGYCVDEISFRYLDIDFDEKDVNNIIDCKNYLEL